jgi:hypothetical protein
MFGRGERAARRQERSRCREDLGLVSAMVGEAAREASAGKTSHRRARWLASQSRRRARHHALALFDRAKPSRTRTPSRWWSARSRSRFDEASIGHCCARWSALAEARCSAPASRSTWRSSRSTCGCHSIGCRASVSDAPLHRVALAHAQVSTRVPAQALRHPRAGASVGHGLRGLETIAAALTRAAAP